MEVGAAGLAIQVADVSGRVLLGMIKLLKDLRETPKQMAELLVDLEISIEQIHWIKAVLQPSTMLSTHLTAAQIQGITKALDKADQAITDLRQILDPLFQKSSTRIYGFAKKAWRAIVSIEMEQRVARRVTRIERLKNEAMIVVQVAELEMGANIM